MTWPDAQNWQSQEDSDLVSLVCYAWEAPYSVMVLLHRKGGLHTIVTVITYGKDSFIACPVDLLTWYICLHGITGHRKVCALGCTLEVTQQEVTFSYSRDEPQHCLLQVACGSLSPCVTCCVRSHKLVQKKIEIPVCADSTNKDGNWKYTRNACWVFRLTIPKYSCL